MLVFESIIGERSSPYSSDASILLVGIGVVICQADLQIYFT